MLILGVNGPLIFSRRTNTVKLISKFNIVPVVALQHNSKRRHKRKCYVWTDFKESQLTDFRIWEASARIGCVSVVWRRRERGSLPSRSLPTCGSAQLSSVDRRERTVNNLRIYTTFFWLGKIIFPFTQVQRYSNFTTLYFVISAYSTCSYC